ncbi:molybdopterin-synthase adenylyltransferase MoeB [Aliarcobacter skirrowii]|uniref:Molybdopterin-synthase adenylyltransferase n=1 Tax=Aliarcobacter skirrowii CCUG 10374 TaxID=1032239 RepID=A0AAD0WP86_9BACT|nr:molybdopterin-synthase adenylyltransferase MoeB [Aliarcobacter skirrowii]AXX85783.1 ThiS adenylyltransferase (Rhodanese domain) [Aliarcobacter skirrowii CCUG 10374]KAB0621976.1 molybdopterin-synthase adenylyltransferase MoeB [Aliarcobacter skirrowii CCUG 10374]MDY0181089.1 molybdopterin-synthase adenylyltransferase MoeB [Aliarcobacter skirrowii]RXI27225.1 molybdenum cofactor biosynthesis protein MoeB [Aliarcobacter skirrowii CCUG 10374]SUU95682.1 Probable adenylyltransferase/sulfurtransfera
MTKEQKLSEQEISRYSRHLILPQVGLEGQLKLKNSKVLAVGTGALGSPILLYLAAAGVGTIGLVDFDVVEESNLHRQIIHTTNDIKKSKVQSAKEKLEALNPNSKIVTFNERLTSSNALNIIKDFDIVIDGTDNFPTRYLINDACVMLKKPFVYGSIFRFEGQVSVFNYDGGACYRCLFPNPPKAGLVPSCSEAGVLGVLPGIIGTIQTNELIKIILKIGEPLKNRLLSFDSLKMQFRDMKFNKNENCPICSKNATIKELIDYEEFCGLKEKTDIKVDEITLEEFKSLLAKKDSIQIVDVRPKIDFDLNNIKDSINIPFESLEDDINQIDSLKKVIVVCKIGMLSKEAILKLKNIGFKAELYSLKGGVTSWLNDL